MCLVSFGPSLDLYVDNVVQLTVASRTSFDVMLSSIIQRALDCMIDVSALLPCYTTLNHPTMIASAATTRHVHSSIQTQVYSYSHVPIHTLYMLTHPGIPAKSLLSEGTAMFGFFLLPSPARGHPITE